MLKASTTPEKQFQYYMFHMVVVLLTIVGQTGQARRASTSPLRKSTARERSGPESFVRVHGPCQAQCRAWSAIASRGLSTGTAR